MRTAPKNPREEPTPAKPVEPEPSADRSAKKEKPSKGKEGRDGKEGKDAPKGKDGKGKGKKGGPDSAKAAQPVSTNPDFRYIVRIANSDLDGRRRTALALTGVRGVGLRIAEAACQLAHVDPHAMIGDLPESVVEGIEATLGDLPKRIPIWMTNHPRDYALGETLHYIGPELEIGRRDNINQMKMIRSYRGVRHERGQKVRGQRTRSNGRTGMAAGVIKKTAKEAAAAAKASEERPSAPAPAAAAAPAASAAPAKGVPGKAAPGKAAPAPKTSVPKKE